MNQKKWFLSLLGLTVLALLATACSTPEPTPTLTSVPPTVTSTATPTATPTSTPVPCPTLSPKSASSAGLKPYRAILRDRVGYQPGFQGYTRCAVPVDEGNAMLVAFFEGAQDGETIPDQDWDWIVRDAQCSIFEPIGFGVPGVDEPVVMFGTVLSGGAIPISESSHPLVALIFVVPKDMETVMFLDPQRAEHEIQISTGWLPTSENLVYGFQLKRLEWSKGESWRVADN